MSEEGTVHILVVDDDPAVRDVLRGLLAREGYIVHQAGSGPELFATLKQYPIGLVTLDLTLGREDGLELSRQVRSQCEVPIIIVTGKADEVDRIVGLALGADDYIVKPFNLREVLARIRAVLRRTARGSVAAPRPGAPVRFGDWVLDVPSRELRRISGEVAPLTTAEFNLLEAFSERRGRVLTRNMLIELLKGNDAELFDRSIDTLVGRLRKKIEPNPEEPTYIKTVRGVGYVFAATAKSS